MGTGKKIAFAIYLLIVLALVASGIAYLRCQTIMPTTKLRLGWSGQVYLSRRSFSSKLLSRRQEVDSWLPE